MAGFGIDHLPYASVLGADGHRFAAVRFGDAVLDLVHVEPTLFADGRLDAFLAAGPAVWDHVRGVAASLIESDALRLVPLTAVAAGLGFAVGDYVDFYASEHHATNAGRILRPGAEPLPANWKHVPVGYYGRAGSLVASGTPIARPAGVTAPGAFGLSQRLDFEAEVAFVVGVPGAGIAVADADRHVFGACLLNDWSARDIQRFETVPLGPFLGKSFATSISPWITPLAALAAVRCAPVQDPRPVAPLRETDPPHGLRLQLQVQLNGTVIARPSFADMYWSYAQMLTHLTSNGAAVRTGDVFASGTVSGPEPDQLGCLLELTRNGEVPITLDDGTARAWLADGDEVVITGTAGTVTLGAVAGRVGTR